MQKLTLRFDGQKLQKLPDLQLCRANGSSVSHDRGSLPRAVIDGRPTRLAVLSHAL